LFVSRELRAGRLSIIAASTRPPARPSGVGSDVDWSEVMAARAQGPDTPLASTPGPFRRFWRGPTDQTSRIRSLLARDDLDDRGRPDRLERDRTLLDTLRILEAMGAALHARATWRRLVRLTGES
jgi:hypothetical protein